MKIFGWLRGRSRRTRLQKFCSSISINRIEAVLESNAAGEGDLTAGYAMATLSAGGHMFSDPRMLKTNLGDIDPDVAIFEASTLLMSMSQTSITRHLTYFSGLSISHPIVQEIIMAGPLACAIIEDKSDLKGLCEHALRRDYRNLHGVEEYARAFTDWIASSAGHSNPAPQRSSQADASLVPINMACRLFIQSFLTPTCEAMIHAAQKRIKR
jgi:hypothetical protein